MIMENSQWLVTVVVALITSGGTFFAAKSTNGVNLAKTNSDTAVQLFQQYRELNDQLQQKVDRLEEKLEKLQEKYEKEIAYYQSEVERLEDENEKLTLEIVTLKGEK